MIELLRARRSIRKYEDRPIEAGTVEVLKEAALRAPSSRNLEPWTFLFVDDPELLVGLARSKSHGSSFVKGAALAVVVLGDEARSDVWVEDCSIASIFLQLVGQAEGLGSCWVQIRRRKHDDSESAEDYVRGLLGVPSSLRVLSIIAFGYPAETREGRSADSLDRKKVMMNRYDPSAGAAIGPAEPAEGCPVE